jgi:hypothetical protein
VFCILNLIIYVPIGRFSMETPSTLEASPDDITIPVAE